MEDKWREKAADRKTSGGRRLLIGAVEDQWREKGDDREQWKTNGGRRLLREQWKTSGGRRVMIGSNGRQVEGEGCRQGAVEDKWREKGADRSSGRQMEGEGC